MPYTCAHGTLSELGRMACERDGGTVRRQGPGGGSIFRVEAVDSVARGLTWSDNSGRGLHNRVAVSEPCLACFDAIKAEGGF